MKSLIGKTITKVITYKMTREEEGDVEVEVYEIYDKRGIVGIYVSHGGNSTNVHSGVFEFSNKSKYDKNYHHYRIITEKKEL